MIRAPARALLALALLLLPLVPTAGAGVPAPAEWSPWSAPSTVNAVAVAAQGRTIAAALGPYSATTNCPPTACPPVNDPTTTRYDLAVLHLDQGFVQGLSSSSFVEASPRGRSLVAVSHDGATIVSVGLEAPEDPQGAAVPTLYYDRVNEADNWTTANVRLSRHLEGTPVGLLLSVDGRRVAVASDVGGNVTVQGFVFRSGILSETFARPELLPGKVSGFAGSGDLSRLVLAASVPTSAGNRSAVVTIQFEGGGASQPHYAPPGVNLTLAAASRDGGAFAVGGANATLLFFRGAGEPQTLTLPANGTVSAVAFSGDGTRMAAAVSSTIQAYDLSEGSLRALWRAEADGAVRGLAYNLTGGILAAAGSSGVAGFDDAGRNLGWDLRGGTSAVAIDDAGTVLAYAQRNLVFGARVPRALVLSHAEDADFGPTLEVEPGGRATYELFVRNPGAATERVTFRGPEELDVDVAFEPASLTVLPGERARVNATVTPGQIQAGARSFNVTAVSSTSGLTDEVTLNLTLRNVVGVGLTVPATEALAQPGEPHKILLGVRNDGTADVAVSLTARQKPSSGPAWNVTLDPASLTLPPNIVTTVRATVTPPANAENGTSNAVTFVLEGGGRSHEAEVVYRINPTLGVEVTPLKRTQYVTSGERVTFEVNVTNTGSLPRDVQVYYDVNDSAGRSWRIDLGADRLSLDAGETRRVSVNVTAPADARTGETLTFTVTAELLPQGDEPLVRDVVPLFAIAAEPVRDGGGEEEGNVIPGPAGPILIAALLSVAVALRRRRAP